MDGKRPLRAAGAAAVVLAFTLVPGFAQEPMHDHSKMAGMDHGMNHGMQMNEAGMYLMNMASGASMNPLSWPMPMLALKDGLLTLLLMCHAYLIVTPQYS